MKRSLSIENIREDCGSWLTELPCQLLEEIFLNLSIKECFGICRTCKHFNEVITSQFFNVRFYREKLSAWDVCRYKIPNESWSCFNCRTLAAYKSMEERVNKVTEDIEKAERDMDDESKKNLVAFTYSKRGLLYLTNLRDFTQAMRDFEKASQLYSGNSVMPSALNNLGVAYLYLGNLHSKLEFFVEAEKKLRQGGQISSSSVSGGNLSVALLKQGRFEEALRHAHEATQLAKVEIVRNANAFHHKGFILYSMGQFERAIHATSQALLWNPKYAECYFTRGLARSALGQHEEAQKDFDTALDITRKSELSIYSYCHMYATTSEAGSEVFCQRVKPSAETLKWLEEIKDEEEELIPNNELEDMRRFLRVQFENEEEEEEEGEEEDDDEED